MLAGHVLEVMSTQRPWCDGEALPERDTLRQWVRRGWLTPRGSTPQGHHLYDVEDVINVALATRRQKATT